MCPLSTVTDPKRVSRAIACWEPSVTQVVRKVRLGELLARLGPDIVGLQEVWWPWRSRFPIVPFHVSRSRRDARLALSGRLASDSRVDLVPFRHHRGAGTMSESAAGTH